jgi:hypothetical protein
VRFWAVAAALLALGCGSGPDPITTCVAERGIHPVCGFQNPEDLALLPDGSVLVSQMGSMDGEHPGDISLYDPERGHRSSLFPSGGPGTLPHVGARAEGWGARDCPGPPGPEFSPHGLDLAERPDGRLQLLVVNHGGREAVEFFEVALRDGGTALEWRGCAIPEESVLMNDVATLPDGGFVATKMFPGGASLWHSLRGLAGFDTGYVMEWSAESGFGEVPGTRAAAPNGVAVAPDGNTIFFTAYMGDEVRRITRDGSRRSASVDVSQPDNLTWASDGRLLVASHTGSIGEMLACNDLEGAACPMSFAIVAIDPESMATEVVFENAGAPMGAGTAALERNGELFIGSFAGDRIIRVPRS